MINKSESPKLSKNKHIVRNVIFALLTQGFIVPGALAVETKAPVNILIMVSDDQRWDQIGLAQAEQGDKARFPFIETPRLDARAAEGMRFRNAFVTTSLCSPSRSAILTGQYNHTNGIIDNFTPFTPRPTWATALQAIPPPILANGTMERSNGNGQDLTLLPPTSRMPESLWHLAVLPC